MRRYLTMAILVQLAVFSAKSFESAQDPIEYNFVACAAREFQAGLQKSGCETIADDIPRLSMISRKSCYDKVINQLSVFRRTRVDTKAENAFIAQLYLDANNRSIDIVNPLLRRCSLLGKVVIHPVSSFLSYVETPK